MFLIIWPFHWREGQNMMMSFFLVQHLNNKQNSCDLYLNFGFDATMEVWWDDDAASVLMLRSVYYPLLAASSRDFVPRLIGIRPEDVGFILLAVSLPITVTTLGLMSLCSITVTSPKAVQATEIHRQHIQSQLASFIPPTSQILLRRLRSQTLRRLHPNRV